MKRLDRVLLSVVIIGAIALTACSETTPSLFDETDSTVNVCEADTTETVYVEETETDNVLMELIEIISGSTVHSLRPFEKIEDIELFSLLKVFLVCGGFSEDLPPTAENEWASGWYYDTVNDFFRANFSSTFDIDNYEMSDGVWRDEEQGAVIIPSADRGSIYTAELKLTDIKEDGDLLHVYVTKQFFDCTVDGSPLSGEEEHIYTFARRVDGFNIVSFEVIEPFVEDTTVDETPIDYMDGFQINDEWKVVQDKSTKKYSFVNSKGERFYDLTFDSVTQIFDDKYAEDADVFKCIEEGVEYTIFYFGGDLSVTYNTEQVICEYPITVLVHLGSLGSTRSFEKRMSLVETSIKSVEEMCKDYKNAIKRISVSDEVHNAFKNNPTIKKVYNAYIYHDDSYACVDVELSDGRKHSICTRFDENDDNSVISMWAYLDITYLD
ncbi:MAG: hypothetical protein FWG45_00870 [Oscillospiraceae bacterium]|nr:hypothetical protein [Oscillospiraceae bacterium]